MYLKSVDVTRESPVTGHASESRTLSYKTHGVIVTILDVVLTTIMPARRSSRLKASNLQSKGNSSASDNTTRQVQEQESNTSSNDNLKNGTRKRQRKAVINPQETDQPVFKLRGKRGKLRLMTEMPMDILFEVGFNPSDSL
jgi:hypothetical protein